MRRAPRAGSGLTLIELLLALAITGIVGAATATMLFAVARGTASRNDLRDLAVRQKAMEGRLAATVRSAHRVLAVGNTHVVLWMGDARSGGVPNLSELRRIEWDHDRARLLAYRPVFPQGWTQEQINDADTAYELTADFNAVTQALKAGGLFPAETWAEAVAAGTFAVRPGEPQTVRVLAYRCTLGVQDLVFTVVGAASLRAP